MKSMLLVLLAALSSTTLAFGEGRVRVVHASPDAPAVDIRVDGQPAIDALPYGEYTDYVTVPEGSHTFEIYVAGTDTRVTQVSANIEPGGTYTVAAVGFAATGKSPAFQVIVLPDNREGPAPGQSYIRFVHASPSTPPVDIYAGSAFQTVRGRDALLTAFPFGVATGYLAVPAGTYFVRLTPASGKTVALDSGRVTLPSQGVRTAFALDGKVLLLMD